MVNRSIQQKILKKKRRGRYARFSGGTTKIDERTGPTPFTEDAQGKVTSLKAVTVFVGKASLSRQVPKGFGPNQERMQTYYERLNSVLTEPDYKSNQTVLELIHAYKKGLKVTVHSITIFKDGIGRLELICKGEECWFVELENGEETRRSLFYSKRSKAIDAYNARRIAWVE